MLKFKKMNRAFKENGSLAIAVIAFIMAAAILAHGVIINSEGLVKHKKEELLKTYLIEYNMALARYRYVFKVWPSSVSELMEKKGFARRLSPDPFTGKPDYLLIEKNGEKYIVSSSNQKNSGGISYRELCVACNRRFVPIGSKKLLDLMAFPRME